MLVQMSMQPFTSYWYTMGCEAGRISEVHMTIRTGALHVEEAFAVRMGEGPWQELLWKTAVMDIYLCVQSRHDGHKSVPAKDPEHRALRVCFNPRGFLWFRVQGEAPVRSCKSVNVLVFSYLCCTWLLPICHILEVKMCCTVF